MTSVLREPWKVGLLLVAMAAGIAGVAEGSRAALSAGGFAILALVIQLGASRLMVGHARAPMGQFLKRYGAGMGLRLLGVAIVGLVIWLEPAGMSPVAAALGYIGVLIPLLFLEARRI